MKALVIYMLETLVCSGVLLALYAILLERQVRFRWCRTYLLLLPLLAGAIPLLRIPVWSAPVIAASTTVTAGEWSGTGQVITDSAAAIDLAIIPAIVCIAIYLLGAALILGLMCWQVARICGLRRKATIFHTKNYTLVRTPKEVASFSFFRSIYVWNGVPEGELEIIVAHEASHIAHRHSIERIGMEALKAILWWNPFVWIAARRLTEVEEFEADHDVLHSGYDTSFYMTTLLKQLFGYSPDIANGLRDSLTKKRFQMMTTKATGRYALLRLAGTIPVVLGLLCLFSFTTKAAVIVPATPTTDHSIRTEAMPETPAPSSVKQSAPEAQPAPTPSVKQTPSAAQPTPPTANSTAPESATEDPLFIRAEVMPTFQGGDFNAFRQWAQLHVRYPAEALKNRISGRVMYSFVVEKDGSIGEFKIHSAAHESLANEVRRMISRIPDGAWTPGSQRGQAVRITYPLSIEFRISNPDGSSAPTSKIDSLQSADMIVVARPQ